jgi:hypothetical protein
MKPFEKLDAAIVKAIESGKNKFYIITAAVEPLALPLALGGPQHAYRVVDRRLQALRKRGLIAYSGVEWRVCTSQGGTK